MNAKIYRICQIAVLILISTLLLPSCGKSDKEKTMDEIAQIDRELVELDVRIAQYARQKDENALSGVVNTFTGEFGSALGNVATGEGLSREAGVLQVLRNQLHLRKYQLALKYGIKVTEAQSGIPVFRPLK
ncbi:hypothetical protein ACAZ08_01830 [Akkermansia muciniphila]|jgi:hypothetical protein|uniref:hypothetical protein n=1 Tax=unclassified Akkermansia TaxID=2608915 RepID=UPI001BFF3251|nr:hypothetical protein [Akkermansia muciniphila]MBT8774946.1 hypothetical protein [Akkermansia muciniphila]